MFEHSLISLDKPKTSRRRLLSLPIAVGLHLAALASFTFASYWHVERVPEPSLLQQYVIEASLPELPQAKIKQGSPAPVEQKVNTEPVKTPEVAQPEQVADKLPTIETPHSTGITLVDAPVGIGDPDGSKDGDPNGSKDGIEGVPFDPNSGGGGGGHQQVAAPVSSEPIRVFGSVTRPVLDYGPQPRYTEMARKAGVQGTVIVEAIIDEQGRVTNVRVLKSLPMGLDQAAVDAVQTWRFKPATLGGRAVKVFYSLTINFSLQR
jgi:protein TonB